MSELRRGSLFAIAAYTIWGLFPLYWPLLQRAGAVEVVAHRIVWSLGLLVVVMALRGNLDGLRAIGARRFALLGLAAALVSVNWGVYVWAVTHHHVVETSLGYFINPLFSVLIGVAFLGERLRRGQWIAVGVAAAAVVVLTLDYGRPPWIALSLATSFGLYGFVKKKAGVGAAPGLTVETSLLFLPALGYLIFLETQGRAALGHVSTVNDLLLVLSGAITVIPLVCFAAAANRIPLSMMGMLQYIAPVLQFLCGVVVFREAMPLSRWLGFALVWLALVVFSVESAWTSRRRVAATPA